jgi:hypothetical protein
MLFTLSAVIWSRRSVCLVKGQHWFSLSTAALRDRDTPLEAERRWEKNANRNGRDFGWETSSRGRFATPAD